MVASLALFFVLFLSALLVGNRTLQLFSRHFMESEEELVFSYAIGLILLSYLVLTLGIVGLLERRYLWIGIVLLGVLGSSQASHIFNLIWKKRKGESGGSVPLWLELCFWSLIIFIGLGAFFPIFASDALTYHLSCPKMFLNMRRVDWIPDDVNSAFPFFTEMLFTLALALKGETVAQLFSWSLGVLLAFSIANFFSRFFDSKKWGRIAAVFFLFTPGVFNEMRLPLVDVAWAAYGFLGFYALIVGLHEDRKGCLWLSSLFMGVTWGIKYLALLSGVATFCVLIIFAFQSRWKPARILRWCLGLGFAATMISGYWYLKAYWVHGNPFYPYFNHFFGLKSLVVGMHAAGEYSHKVGMGRSLPKLLLLPFNLTFFPTRFDGWGEQWGVAYLIFLPFLVWGIRSPVGFVLALYGIVFTLGWFWLAQVTRFLYPALPFLTILIIRGFSLFLQRRDKKLGFCKIVFAFVLLLQGALLVYHSRQGLTYLIGRESRGGFLAKRERSYSMAKFINENLPPDAKILNAEEVRTFYFDRNLVRESLYRFRTDYDRANNFQEVLARLKKDRFTHLLLTDGDPQKEKRGIRRWVEVGASGKGLKPIYRSLFQEKKGRRVEYVLYSF